MVTEKAQHKVYRDLNLQIIFAITLMAVLGVSSISPAFTSVSQRFNISETSVGLLITVFTLQGVFLTPFFGVLADRWGRKKVLVPSLFLFAIAGGACAFAPNFNILLLFRFFQGIGAASLGSLNQTLIGDIYTGKERAAAMGYNASVLSIGTASYPVLGGALAMFGWYYPFLLPLLAIPIALIVIFKLNNPEPKNTQNLGKYLITAAKYINNRQVYALFTAATVTFIILYGAYITYFPFIIGGLGGSPFITGMVMFSMSITTALTSAQLGNLIKRFSAPKLLKTAFLIYAVALFMVPFANDILFLLIPTFIFGIGHGINLPSNQTILASLAPMEYRAAFMSLNGMVLRLGQTLGPLVMGLMFTLGGITSIFFAGCVLAIFVMFLLSRLLK